MIVLCLALALQQPSDSLTLSEALERARRQRGIVASAAAGVAGARAAARTAGGIPNPTISYSHTESTPVNHFLVDQSFDWLFRRGPDRAAGRAGVARAVADSAGAVTSLLHEVRVAFYRARAARLAESLVGAQASLADSVAGIAAARLRAGDISQLEQEQAALEAQRARQTESAARETARAAEADLARALGWDGPAPGAAGALDAGLDQIPGDSLEDSELPAVRAAVADSTAAAAQARSAGLARIPLPTLQSGAEWGDDAQPGALAVIGISLPFPLWNHGGGAAAAAKARAEQTAALTREARLDAVRQVRQARIHLEESAARARDDRDTLAPAAAALRARSVRAYQAGETGILPVLDALRTERDVLLTTLRDQLTYQEALADWYALSGRSE
jgi:outer membrane protein, heavy metal efflux system